MHNQAPKVIIGLILAVVLLQVSCTNAGIPPTATPQPTATKTSAPTATPTPTTTATPTSLPPSPTPPPNPSAAIAPTSGDAGTQIQLTASGFPPDTPVEIGAGQANAEYDVIDTARTDAQGALSMQTTIPAFVEPNERWVIVVDSEDARAKAVSNVFQVTGGASPAVDISPTQGPPGTEIRVAAEDFPPNTTVEVGVGVKNTEYWNSQDIRTDAVGALQTTMTIPPSAEPGEHWVAVVRVVRRGGAKAISEDFVVSQPAAKFTQVDIYLIALGDEGRTGKEIGCGDSLIPVEVEIEPTVAPLAAALEELLALREQEYGQSGLYNALYRSNLALESVDIDAGEAVIHISGEISVGGACDIPRIKAQIEETALQFSTVDEAEVLINSQPLDQALSTK